MNIRVKVKQGNLTPWSGSVLYLVLFLQNPKMICQVAGDKCVIQDTSGQTSRLIVGSHIWWTLYVVKLENTVAYYVVKSAENLLRTWTFPLANAGFACATF